MHTTVRPFATAGVAMVAAGAIALTPIAPPLPDVAVAASGAVQLTATFDPITPWLDVFNTSEMNIAALANLWLEAPLPVVQQVIANQIRYLGELPDIGAIAGQMLANVRAGVAAPFAADPSLLDPDHQLLYSIITAALGPDASPLVSALVGFLASPASGILMGAVGPVISPILALGDSVQNIVANLTSADPDLVAALNDVVNIPAAMTGAFLNGHRGIDLTPLLSLAGVELPAGVTVGLGIAMGGLLSPGGSLFSAIDANASIEVPSPIPGRPPITITLLDASGSKVGPIGSLIATSNAIAKAFGWDGSGNPLAPPAPQPTLSVAGNGLAPANTVPPSVMGSTTTTLTTTTDDAVDNAADQAGPQRGTALTRVIRDSVEAAPGATGAVPGNDVGTGIRKAVKSAGAQSNANAAKIGKKSGVAKKAPKHAGKRAHGAE